MTLSLHALNMLTAMFSRGYALATTRSLEFSFSLDFSKELPESLGRDQDPQTMGLGKASFLMKPG